MRSGRPSSHPKTPDCCWSSWDLPTIARKFALNFIVREHDLDTEDFPPAALAVVIAAIGRTLILEQGLGTAGGHDEAVALVHRFLDKFEMPQPKTRQARAAQSG